jgi:hypothetical protein
MIHKANALASANLRVGAMIPCVKTKAVIRQRLWRPGYREKLTRATLHVGAGEALKNGTPNNRNIPAETFSESLLTQQGAPRLQVPSISQWK